MELLLNLLWLSMALPAIWLWRQQRGTSRNFRAFHAGLILASALVLLFPTISVSDDLQPMRAEVEDSALSKRIVRLSAPDTGSHVLGNLAPPGYAVPFFLILPDRTDAGAAILPHAIALTHRAAHAAISRGPPTLVSGLVFF